jgi:hypothetical protein
MTAEPTHPCPCCGYRTYLIPAGGSRQLCPVCFWEDAPGEPRYNGSNQVSLVEAQRNFTEFGACERCYRNAVRPPEPEESRSANWLTIDGLREKLILEIEQAFADVSLDDGVTLHQMQVLDDYGGEAEQLAARRKDPETRWQLITGEKLSLFSDSMVFLDAEGFQFHLPAFLRHALITAYPSSGAADTHGVMFALQDGPRKSYHEDGIKLLVPTQMQCIASFFHYFARSSESGWDSEARKALKAGWNEWTPDFVRLSLL